MGLTMLNIKLKILFLLCVLAAGCGQSASPILNPAQAQTDSTTATERLKYLIPLSDRPGETLGLNLHANGASVSGTGFLEHPGDGLIPLVVEGSIDTAGLASLMLYPDDIELTESLEVSGILRPGGEVSLRQTGQASDYGHGLVADAGSGSGETASLQGGTETMAINFNGVTPVNGTPLNCKMRLDFTTPGYFQKTGRFVVTSQSDLPDDPHGFLPAGACRANFFLGSTTVEIELFEARDLFVEDLRGKQWGHIWIREGTRLENGRIPLDDNSSLDVAYTVLSYYDGTSLIPKRKDVRAAAGSYLEVSR